METRIINFLCSVLVTLEKKYEKPFITSGGFVTPTVNNIP